jgi:hypothetical protein
MVASVGTPSKNSSSPAAVATLSGMEIAFSSAAETAAYVSCTPDNAKPKVSRTVRIFLHVAYH